ncbi:O-antigen ligase family protein [Caviibacterium pharyngocola]|uniref:RfaL protein n=1 Tax=Caviibacterium pharyngocola TaxID=28159 RepID=A0A2M8RSS8_9PAST|nr:O-antigen ligase [Caviibacterium pharyngocola]PJG81935.1 RfaL protein [Caviibacterium pharyngocola]
MNILKNDRFSLLLNFIVGFFFLAVLGFKGGHNISPILLMVIGLGYLIYFLTRKQKWQLDQDEKRLMISYAFYFAVFVLSLIFNGGKMKELDNPSRVILLLPLLLLFIRYPIRFNTLAYAVPLGGIVAGLVAIYDRFYLHAGAAFSPRTMHIQGGDIAMSLGMFSLLIGFYFATKKHYKSTALCVFGTLSGITGSLLSTARGGWIGLPIILAIILFLYRKQLSKTFFLSISGVLIAALVIAVSLPETKVMKRIQTANNEITAYFEKNNGGTSVGARFDMWKSALLMAKEKPLLGWGQQGAVEQHKKHAEQKLISKYAAIFDHAHNQYIDDLAKRGVIGLLALLGVLLIPLRYFIRSLKTVSLETRTLAGLGIVHIVSVMCYCVSQGFFTHNSGNIFYFFLTLLFFAMVKSTQKIPSEH